MQRNGDAGSGSAGVSERDEAIDVLFRRHYAELLRLAYGLVGDRGAAEDVVQDAFVSLHRHWGRLRDPGAAPDYLRSTVVNRSRSRVRELARARAPRPWRPVRDVEPSAEEGAMAHDQADRLTAAVRALPRRQREVVACRYFLGLSEAETAALLSISVGSVKRHAHRAVHALASRVEVVS